MLKPDILERFDPDLRYFKQAVRTAVSGFIAILFFRHFVQLHEAYWAVITAAFIIQTRLGSNQFKMTRQIAMAGLLSAIFATLVTTCIPNILALAIFLAITTFIAVYLSCYGLEMAITAFFINLLVVISAGLTTTAALERGWMILVGTIIAMAASLIFPFRRQLMYKKSLHVVLQCFSNYLLCIHKGASETHLHERRNRCLRWLRMLKKMESNEDQSTTDLVHDIYEWVVFHGTRRFSTSSVAFDELGQKFFKLCKEPVQQIHRQLILIDQELGL